MSEKYAICYIRGDIERGIESAIPVKEVIKLRNEGMYKHTDYYCAIFNDEAEANEAYLEYKNSMGEECDRIYNAIHFYVSALSYTDAVDEIDESVETILTYIGSGYRTPLYSLDFKVDTIEDFMIAASITQKDINENEWLNEYVPMWNDNDIKICHVSKETGEIIEIVEE